LKTVKKADVLSDFQDCSHAK